MQAQRAETILSGNGAVTLRGVPFRRGGSVEAIVLPFPAAAPDSRHPLRGKPVTLLRPADPADDGDWAATA